MINIPTAREKGRRHVKITAASGLMSLLLMIACNSPGASDSPAEHLNAYCIRECVIETGDSEICDARCKCAVQKLASELSAKELSAFADTVAHEENDGSEESGKLRSALEACISEK